MSGIESKKIEGLFESVLSSLNKLDELEQSYNTARGSLVTELAFYLSQLAALADSQAVRAQIVRKLYWNEKIPATLIGEAFGLKTRAIRKIAGALILTLPCPSECGNSVKREFTSRNELEDYYREAHRSKKHSYRSYLSCDECKQKAEAEREAETLRKRNRNVELQHMPWEEFIETKEWIDIRNTYMYHVSYQCERCHISDVGLYIYLGKETPQNYPLVSIGEYRYYVLCGSCVPSCEELINVEKGEYVKGEFISKIMNWNQGFYEAEMSSV
jgi:hypothetical protein